MTEIVEPRTLMPEDAPEPGRFKFKVKISDIIIFAIIIIAIVALSIFIVNKLQLKHEVSQAKTAIATNVVTDLSKQDTKALRLLGDSTFQAKNSATALSAHLTATDQNGSPITFAELYGKTKPTIDMQIVTNNSRGKHVVFIYKYSRLKARQTKTA